ncbi:MAG: hypothetical protein AAB440_03160 [Patescibacteria group bacterium]
MKTALIILAIIVVIGGAAVLFWALTLNNGKQNQVEVRDAFEQAIEQAEGENLAPRITPKESSVVGDYALQIWSDENIGGVALMKNESGKGWVIVAIDGGAWDVVSLVAEGVPENIAVELVKVQE